MIDITVSCVTYVTHIYTYSIPLPQKFFKQCTHLSGSETNG